MIVGYDGKPVEKMRDLPRMVAATPVGKTVTVELLRAGNRKSVSVSIAKMKADRVASLGAGQGPSAVAAEKLGVQLATLDDQVRSRLNLPQDASGVVVIRVDPEGRAAEAGLRPGDVIVRVGPTTVKTPSDVAKAVGDEERGSVLLLVNRGGNTFFVGVRLAET